MNKERILERSRLEKHDEGKLHILETWHSLSRLCQSVVCLIIHLVSLVFGGEVEYLYGVSAMFWISYSGDMFGLYKIEKSIKWIKPKGFLCLGCLFALLSIINLIQFIALHFQY